MSRPCGACSTRTRPWRGRRTRALPRPCSRRWLSPMYSGKHLEIELGVDRRIVSLLIERGSELDGPLNLAGCFNRAELVGMLLEAGAQQVASPVWGITPLQAALY